MKEMVGLDIGFQTIKLAVLKKTSRGLFLTNLGMKEIPYQLDRRDTSAMAQLLRGLMDEMGLKIKKVYLTFSGSGIYIRHITLPSIPKEELKEAISWEIKGQLPYPLETAQLAFYILREFIEEEIKKFEILIVACPKEKIERSLSIVKEAGLQPIHMEVTPISLWNALVSLDRLKKEEVIAVVDLGAEKTNLYLFEQGVLVFHREIIPGGQDITQTLLNEIPTLTFEQGEKIKKEIGISLKMAPVESRTTAKESFVMRPIFERMAGEIGRSIEFFRNQFIIEKVDKILLSGGGAHLKNILPYLEEELRMKVEIFNPTEALFYDPQGVPPALLSLGASFGPAIGATLKKPVHIEFLSVKEPFFSKTQWPKRIPLLASIAASIFFILLIWHTEIQLSQLEKERNEKIEKIKNLESIKSTLLLLKQKETKMKEEYSFLPSREKSSLPYVEMLKTLSEMIPNNVTLTLLEIQTEAASSQKDSSTTSPGFFYLSGFIFGNDIQTLSALAQLIERLEQSNYFSRVKLISAQESKTFFQKASTFEIQCEFPNQILKREELL